MIYRIFLLFFITMISSSGYAFNMSFAKDALQLMAKHFSKELPALEEQLNNDALNYLKASISFYKDKQFPHYDLFSGFSFEELGSCSIMTGGQSIISYGNGIISINGVQQKTHIQTIYELKAALINNHCYSVRNLLSDIAVAAQQELVDSKKEENIEHAKAQATSSSTPSELRSKLLGVLANVKDPALRAWLLKQKDFEGTAKDNLIQKLVDESLANNQPQEAGKLIKNHLQAGYSAQEKASDKLFYYYFNKGDLNSAEQCLQRHYTKGYSSSDKLVKVLVEYLVGGNNFKEARAIANRNMSVGYTEHNKLDKYILERQVEFLSNK